MSRVIRLSNETEELLDRTKKEFIEACKNSFSEAEAEKNIEECLEWDRIITEANQASDSVWIYKCLFSFRKNTGLEE